jgi:predicted transcriptional regulator
MRSRLVRLGLVFGAMRMNDAVISIKPRYVEKYLCGTKSAEIRNRPMTLPPGSRLWMYSTLPKGCIEAVAHVRNVEIGRPSTIWRQHNDSLGVSKKIFDSYVNGSIEISIIVIEKVWHLPREMSLDHLRRKVPNFHPPQFLKYMSESDPLLSAITDFVCNSANTKYCREIGINKRGEITGSG